MKIRQVPLKCSQVYIQRCSVEFFKVLLHLKSSSQMENENFNVKTFARPVVKSGESVNYCQLQVNNNTIIHSQILREHC